MPASQQPLHKPRLSLDTSKQLQEEQRKRQHANLRRLRVPFFDIWEDWCVRMMELISLQGRVLVFTLLSLLKQHTKSFYRQRRIFQRLFSVCTFFLGTQAKERKQDHGEDPRGPLYTPSSHSLSHFIWAS